MSNSSEFLIQRIKENSKWYFGHDVQVITFYNPSSSWNAIVIPAHSTRASALESSTNNDIHFSGSSRTSLYQVLNDVQWQLESEIGKKCHMDEGSKTLSIDESNAPCNCQHVESSPGMVKQKDKLRELEERLQGLEKGLVDGTATFGDANVPGSACYPSSVQGISSVLQKIESKLEAIEQQIQQHTAERSYATHANDETIYEMTNRADIRDDQPNPSANDREQSITEIPDMQLGGEHQRSECQPELAEPGAALESHSRSSAPFSQCGSAADMTPSGITNERFVTSRVGPDTAAEFNRDIMREEINEALAEAMFGLAKGLLRKAGGSRV
ncbi:hypothetical protein Q9L58_005857 [Maublancomyces gigas]|uniref:Uncharacterized protein n=1 Tax=Discina gigas TaxID=1032678 RepID=A0ABR3GH00_9PEZI